MENNKNFILAIALSLAVLIGWQFLYMGPAQKARQQAIEAAQKAAETQTAKTGTQQVSGGQVSSSAAFHRDTSVPTAAF